LSRNVVSTPFTFIATNTAIKESGNLIVWAGLQPETLCSDPDSVMEKVQECLPMAVVITMVGGCAPIGLDALYEELKQLGIPLVLDCAHALLTTYKGKHISHWADFTCFSFQAIKHLTTGDGGALVCRKREHYLLAEKLKWFGLPREVPPGMTRLEHQMKASATSWGYKFHMNDIAAAIGLSNMDVARGAVATSRENAKYFDQVVSEISGLSLVGNKECDSSCWAYGFRVGDHSVMEAVARFAEMGIVASPLWPMNSIHQCFPGCDEAQPNAIFVPNGFWVGQGEREQIASGIKDIFGVST
jgi:dTDP-4-amino-4,6-dideoxygalactose transaminase